MEIYTVTFFGHRQLSDPFGIEARLESILHDLINMKEYVEFLIGRDGEFDLLVSSVIKQAVAKYSCGNTSHILVLPYTKAEFRDNEQSYLEYYDEVEICSASAQAHPKAAIQIRNRSMVDRSDMVICYVQHKSGGSYKTIQYAKKQGKRIINLAKVR